MAETITVYANPTGQSWPDIQAATKIGNGLQTQFKFDLQEYAKDLPSEVSEIDYDSFAKRIKSSLPNRVGLICCEGYFDNRILVNERLPNFIFISCKVSKGLKSPPFKLYLLYQMASAALTLTSRISDEVNDDMMHSPPTGCLWDWWTEKGQRSAAMVAARICPDCRSALATHGNSTMAQIEATQQILDYVRRCMMGEKVEIANRIFLSYGHSDDWKQLVNILEKWGLQVEYFNRQSAANTLIADRWRQMLNASRFAFAIMTPDDELKDGKRQARQNVVHEIGLCHARIGLQNTTILLANGTETFSNVDGVNYIPFDKGNIRMKESEIRKLLEDRGIL